MKKILCALLALTIITGCSCSNTEMKTPTEAVENFLDKYKNNDAAVISDLQDTLSADLTMTDNERSDYEEFMKNHYRDLNYKVLNETINNDSATVETEVTVRSYAEAINDANAYRNENASEFDEDNTFASYRLDHLKEVTTTETYVINFRLTKENGEWKVDPLTSDEESQINGFYGADLLDENYNNDNINDDATDENNDLNDNITDDNNDLNDNTNDNNDLNDNNNLNDNDNNQNS